MNVVVAMYSTEDFKDCFVLHHFNRDGPWSVMVMSHILPVCEINKHKKERLQVMSYSKTGFEIKRANLLFFNVKARMMTDKCRR